MPWSTWLKENWKIAGIFVVVCLIALASAGDGYRTRKLLKAAQTNLEEAAKVKEKELKEAEAGWLRSLNASDAKLAPVLRERDDLRAKLAARDKTPFEAPATDKDTVARWKALGYAVRMGPCK